MIVAKNFIQTGFSAEDAENLDYVIKPLVLKKERVIIDFTDVKNFTSLFFNNALSKYVVELGPAEYEKLFEINNLSKIGLVTYQHSLENAKEYFVSSKEQRDKQNDITSELEDY